MMSAQWLSHLDSDVSLNKGSSDSSCIDTTSFAASYDIIYRQIFNDKDFYSIPCNIRLGQGSIDVA